MTSTSITTTDLADLCVSAAIRAGATEHEARILADATVAAELARHRAVGVAHLFDYLDAYRAGRISPGVEPTVHRPTAATLISDAGGGLAQVAFDAALPELRADVEQRGLGALWVRNSYTCGELAYYPRLLAQAGLFALAFANSPALMSIGGSRERVLGTNPMAFAVPRPGRAPYVVDQATSATAYVNVRDAARDHKSIPLGWAVGPDGGATTEATAALAGALLPFGSYRGGNVALLVELLATLAGASYSVDAAPFDSGTSSPRIGMCVLCFDAGAIAGDAARMADHLDRLADDYGVALRGLDDKTPTDSVLLERELYDRLVLAGE